MLTCIDEIVKETAHKYLKDSVAFAFWCENDQILPETTDKYFHNDTTILRWPLASLWSQKRQAVNWLNISVNHSDPSSRCLLASVSSELQQQALDDQPFEIYDESKIIKMSPHFVIH